MQTCTVVGYGSGAHEFSVGCAGTSQRLAVACKPGGLGSAVNGGEFLMLALAPCDGNDLYREAARMQIKLESVEAEASAVFEGMARAALGVARRECKYASPSQ